MISGFSSRFFPLDNVLVTLLATLVPESYDYLSTHFSSLHSCCESQPEELVQELRHALPLHT